MNLLHDSLKLGWKYGYFFPKTLVNQISSLRLSSLAGTQTVTSSLGVSSTEVKQTNEPDRLYRVLEIEIRGNDPAVLKSYSWFATTAAQELGIKVGECYVPRKAHHERLTLLKSVHIYKKHRVQYEVRTYFRFLNFLKLTGSMSDTFLEYIQRNLPEGVAMKVTKVALEVLPQNINGPIKKELNSD